MEIMWRVLGLRLMRGGAQCLGRLVFQREYDADPMLRLRLQSTCAVLVFEKLGIFLAGRRKSDKHAKRCSKQMPLPSPHRKRKLQGQSRPKGYASCARVFAGNGVQLATNTLVSSMHASHKRRAQHLLLALGCAVSRQIVHGQVSPIARDVDRD